MQRRRALDRHDTSRSTFPGGVIDLNRHFTLVGGRITDLVIAP